ncbi:MAG: hypothetical protein IPH08_10615 [Rhodocyclaceae bacterium]|jgi:hypothetical protein|nr:hypothetical protein [Rhodocyclaceae bacterium]MBK6906230.1 hypothetical protein [Rhodocyclaceae bacterium]MBK6907498.1 hypothetical protein [Rhodocyclaceae bacterium]
MSVESHATSAISGPLLEDVSLLADKQLEVTTSTTGQRRYRIAGIAMAWCSSMAEAVKIGSILQRMDRAAA